MLSDASGEDDGVCAFQGCGVGPDGLADAIGEHLQGLFGAFIAFLGGLFQCADIAAQSG